LDGWLETTAAFAARPVVPATDRRKLSARELDSRLESLFDGQGEGTVIAVPCKTRA